MRYSASTTIVELTNDSMPSSMVHASRRDVVGIDCGHCCPKCGRTKGSESIDSKLELLVHSQSVSFDSAAFDVAMSREQFRNLSNVHTARLWDVNRIMLRPSDYGVWIDSLWY